MSIHGRVQLIHRTLLLLGRDCITWERVQQEFDVYHLNCVHHFADEQYFIPELPQDEFWR